jgi:integrase-like protein
VHGTGRFARRQLDGLVVEAGRARLRTGTLADLLDQWFEAASPGWAPTTVSHTRSIIDCHLNPHIGHLDLDKLTTVDIDDFYGYSSPPTADLDHARFGRRAGRRGDRGR